MKQEINLNLQSFFLEVRCEGLFYTNCSNASEMVKSDVVEMIHAYVEGLKNGGTYDEKASGVLKFKLLADVFDVFGNSFNN